MNTKEIWLLKQARHLDDLEKRFTNHPKCLEQIKREKHLLAVSWVGVFLAAKTIWDIIQIMHKSNQERRSGTEKWI